MSIGKTISQLTPLLLGGAVVVVAARAGVFQNLAKAGEGLSEGIGTGSRGIGQGVSELARGIGGGVGGLVSEAGQAGQNILDVLDPLGELFRGSAGALRRSSEQAAIEDAAVSDIRTQGAIDREIINQREKTETFDRITSLDDKILGFGATALRKFKEVGSIVSIDAFSGGLLSAGLAKALVNAKAGITGRSIDTIPEPPQISLPSSSPSQTKAGGTTGTSSLRQSTASISDLKMNVAPVPNQFTPIPTKTSLRSRISSFFSRIF